MIYAKVDVKLRDHERAHRAGDAMATWAWALLYAVEQETDGFVPDIAMRLGWVGEREARRHASKLVEVGLWEKADSGWRICRFDQKNETAAAIAERRRLTRERVAKFRNSSPPPVSNGPCNALPPSGVTEGTSRDVPGSGSGSGSGSVSREGEPERETAEARYREAYAAGISRGKAAPWVWPGTKYAEWDLGKIISGHAKDPNGKAYRGDQLLRFIEHRAAEFASDVLERKISKFYSAFEPRGCLKWLNEEALAEEARRVG